MFISHSSLCCTIDNKLLATNKTIKLKCSKCLTTKSIIRTAAKRRVVRSRPGWQQLTQYCSVRYCTDQRCLIVRMWDHQMLQNEARWRSGKGMFSMKALRKTLI